MDICRGFKDWMNLEDLAWAGKNDTYGHEEVHNRRNGLIILHDFASGVPLEEQYLGEVRTALQAAGDMPQDREDRAPRHH